MTDLKVSFNIKVFHPAFAFKDLGFAIDKGHPCGIISTVFKPFKAAKYYFTGRSVPYIANNSAHNEYSLDIWYESTHFSSQILELGIGKFKFYLIGAVIGLNDNVLCITGWNENFQFWFYFIFGIFKITLHIGG